MRESISAVTNSKSLDDARSGDMKNGKKYKKNREYYRTAEFSLSSFSYFFFSVGPGIKWTQLKTQAEKEPFWRFECNGTGRCARAWDRKRDRASCSLATVPRVA